MADTHFSSIDAVDHDGSAAGLKLAGTLITATAAEINKLDGAGAVVASGTAVTHIADIATDANGTAIAAAVNAIIDALEAFGIDPGA